MVTIGGEDTGAAGAHLLCGRHLAPGGGEGPRLSVQSLALGGGGSVLWPVGGAEDATISCHSESELSLDLEALCFRFFFFFFSFLRFLCFSFFFLFLRFSLSPEELELLSSSSEVESSSNCFNCWILDRATTTFHSSSSE